MVKIFLAGNDRLVIVTALARFSKTIPTSGSEFSDLVCSLVDEVKTPCTATIKDEKKVESQNEIISVTEKLANNTLNEPAGFLKRVAVSCTREAELLSSASAA